MNFLFWNTARKNLSAEVAVLAAEHQADIVILAEAEDHAADHLAALNNSKNSCGLFSVAPFGTTIGEGRVVVFASLPPDWISAKASDNTCVIYGLKSPGLPSLLLACVHLPSAVHFTEIDRASNAACTARMISEEEETAGHCRTLVIGDFNMNPFEPGMTGIEGFHAVLDRRIARSGSRKVQKRTHGYFYNPMWRFMNDERSAACGSHYYSKSVPVCHFWNTFDQVLLRPSLLPAFQDSGIQIIDSVGGVSLLDGKGRPTKMRVSDHLPVILNLDLQKL